MASKTQTAEANDSLPENDNPWLMWLDSSPLMLALLGFVNGAMNLFGQGPIWLNNLHCCRFGVGAGIHFMYHFVYRHMGEGKTP